MVLYEVAKILDEIGDYLELTEDNPYKARAFYRGAQSLRENAASFTGQVDLKTLPGIGDSLAGVIQELTESGNSPYYDEVKGRISPEFRKLLHLPGLGAKTVRLILKELKPKNMNDLERALEKREIRKLKGLSSKTEAKLKRGLEMLQTRPEQFLLGVALPLGRELIAFLTKLPGVEDAGITGSTLRGRETVRDLDLVVASLQEDIVAEAFASYPRIEQIIAREENHLRGMTWFGMPIDLYIVPPTVFQATVEHLAGHVGHHAKLRQLGAEKGLEWELIPPNAYELLGLPLIPPELREAENSLNVPGNLLQLTDIKGDLHMHTRWSDGGHSIKEMAEAAAAKGYEYIAVCDHSKNLAIAKGLNPEQVISQRREIDQVNEELNGKIKVLAGTEADILKDGSLDFPDEILTELDVVVGSVHMRYKQEIEEMTCRVEAALKNPHVDILAHPTGRLVGRRDPYDLHLERVFEMAVKNNKALEINASPSRLDLKDKYASMARDYGIPIVIDTDAHSIEELADMEYGVMTARRAGLEKQEVLNTKSRQGLEHWLKSR
ncbi:MAG TPA: DNA polymerase/3'-5' exonuclease PolX [Verrucomicrobiae bacterium]|nr:DNA polymerase/3'-5' exonuclease PolX [Verrucomicrobiae bacterium]